MPIVELPTGITLSFESIGSPDDPTVLLIAGFGAQLLSWDEGMCEQLVERGLRVVRFDNRDCGQSTAFDDVEVDLGAVMTAASTGQLEAARQLAAYTLHDMADDAAGLIEALGLPSVHVVGASMGGMVAQLVASRHTARVRSLTSMMSSTGESHVGQSTPEAMAALLSPPANSRDEFIETAVRSSRVWSSRRYFDESTAAELAAASYDRSFRPAGTMRQLAALLATGPLTDELAALAVPTLVIHGRDDTLITPSGGERTAELVPGARLVMIEDMGHDRPPPLWPDLCDLIADHVHAAEAR
ncbi:MAG: alpha/beta hydrolase [Acidimicrobiales bacterium]